MGLSFERRTILTARSERVKCIDFHPIEPWMLASLYSGVITIWNYETQTMVKSIEVCDMPVRAVKFIARKNWIIVGADDLIIRVYNYNTLEKVTQFDAHSDYIRQFAIHPSRSYVLSCSDDMTVKLWDWEKGWKCITTYEGHAHYVMSVAFNPKDSNTFATASLDRTIKIWNLGSSTANYTLEGHEKGVNCIDYYGGGDRPYLVTGGDDSSVRVWDYQTKVCVRVIEGHVQNISVVLFHPDLPLILSGSEDGSVKVWNATSFRSEATFNFSLDRVWALAVKSGSTEIAVGCDEGSIVIQLGKGEPAASMDNNGKLIWAQHNVIMTANIKQSFEEKLEAIVDGQRLKLTTKELGHCEVYPQLLRHSPNGRFVVVCGDGEYIIYTALAWRNKTFGKGLELVWASGNNNDYAIRETPGKLSVYTNFVETGVIRIATTCERIFGGALIGAACVGGQLCFFEWNSCQLVRRIDVDAKGVYWSDSGAMVAICTVDCIYFLRYDSHIVTSYLGQNEISPEDGIEESFEGVCEIEEKIVSGFWVGECFVFVTASNRIAYAVGGTVYPIAIAEKPVYLVGFLSKDNLVILVDRDANVITYTLSLAVVEYKSAILRGDLTAAETLRGKIPLDQVDKVAQFLDTQGHKDLALAMAIDDDFKFSLTIQLKKLDTAFELAARSDSSHKWRELGDLAIAEWKTSLAEKCFIKSNDLSSLLLLYSSSGNSAGLLSLASLAMEQAQYNIAFSCYFIIGRREECLELLIQTKRYPEAAIFARTYLPSAIDRAVKLWRNQLTEKRHRGATLIADPITSPSLFPEFSDSISAEQGIRSTSIRSRVSFESSIASHSEESAAITSSLPLNSPYEPAFSDHMSMEVNTGTGSMRADDLDDLASVTVSESRDESISMARNLERLSIQELEEEHRLDLKGEPIPEEIDSKTIDPMHNDTNNYDVKDEITNEGVNLKSFHPTDQILFDDEDGWD